MVWVGFTFGSMQALTGWQATLAISLQHVGRAMTGAFAWLPNWAVALILLLLVALLAWRALWQVESRATSEETQAYNGEQVDDESMKENISEH
jgi:hypothetical protein